MFIVAQHQISDPATFWSTVQEAAPTLPSDVKLRQVLPNAQGTEAICLWEADSVDAVREVVEGSVGAVSTNTFFTVDSARAVGLPTSSATAD
jgi:hypothetical protein